MTKPILVAAFILGSLGHGIAIACSCWPNPSTEKMAAEWWEISETIVLGTVLTVRPIEDSGVAISFKQNWVELDVIERLKGRESGQTVTVLVSDIGCGPNLQIGNVYLLLAHRFSENEPLTNEGCGAFLYESPGIVDSGSERRKTVLEGYMDLFRKIGE